MSSRRDPEGSPWRDAQTRARRFCDQFLSTALEKRVRYGSEGIVRDRVFRKKARMMAHWASEMGVRLAIEEPRRGT